MKLKKLGAFAATGAMALALALTGCGSSNATSGSDAGSSSSDDVKVEKVDGSKEYALVKDGTLTVGTSAEYAPFEYKDDNGDLKIEGEITQYSQRNKSVSASGQSAQTELSITVNVRFTNNVNHSEDFERQFTSSKSYETTQSLATVQEELVTQMVKDITEQIFNATVANW